MIEVSFTRPTLTGKEQSNIAEVLATRDVSGPGRFTRECERWLEEKVGCRKALLTPSCNAALELIATLMKVQPGDEIIMPSFTFVATANAFATRGAKPVFVDIRPDTLNIDESLIEAAVTPKTRAIVVVHYAGVGCEMDAIAAIARKHKLILIEDAAHGLLAKYRGKPLGSLSDASTLSFHQTKNLTCGQGGALMINREDWLDEAQIIYHKGTDRHLFEQGKRSEYSWVGPGGHYYMSELQAAFLAAQFYEGEFITSERRKLWEVYQQAFHALKSKPQVPEHCFHNAHVYYMLLNDRAQRDRVIAALKAKGITAPFHYTALHLSEGYRIILGNEKPPALPVTEKASNTLIRLPLWVGMESQIDYVIENVTAILQQEGLL